MKTGKYDICFITYKTSSREYAYNSSIKRFYAYDNCTEIQNIIKHENIDILIYQNIYGSSWLRKYFHSFGKKVISIYHGVFISKMTVNHLNSYRIWNNFDFDSFVIISPDDYYFYKKLGFKNEIFVPNMLTFEPSEIKNSNLTYNNIIILGRINDELKGAKICKKKP